MKAIMTIEKIISECEENHSYNKGNLLVIIGELHQSELDSLMDEIKKLIHHKNKTIGLWARKDEPFDLLHTFWQRTSDACPLECTEAEKQQDEFHDYLIDKFEQIDFEG